MAEVSGKQPLAVKFAVGVSARKTGENWPNLRGTLPETGPVRRCQASALPGWAEWVRSPMT